MKDSSAWMYTLLPISAISGGLSVILPLYILLLGGTVYDVGIAITLFELISIPASLFWGDLTDKLDKTKIFILVSILGLFPVLLIFYLFAFVPTIESFYGIYAFLATASSPAINILIMSNKRNPALPKYFSRYSVLSIVGSLAGMFPGLFIDGSFVREYLLILLLINAVSLIMAISLVKADKNRPLEANIKEVKHSFAILNMLSVTPYILTGQILIDRLRAGLTNRKTRNIYVLLGTIALFNLGLFLFNASYIPYLSTNSVSNSGIFLINIINNGAQLGVYALVLSFVKRLKLKESYKASTLVRGAGYGLALLPLFAVQNYFFAINVIAYMISGIAYAFWNISSSVLLYTQIRNLGRGHYIGLWTALLGFSAVLGAFFSGFISSTLGYIETFSLAIAAMLFSFLVFTHLQSLERVRGEPNI